MRTGIMMVFKNVENQVPAKIDVLLVDDHAVVRAGYKAYLSKSGLFMKRNGAKLRANFTSDISLTL